MLQKGCNECLKIQGKAKEHGNQNQTVCLVEYKCWNSLCLLGAASSHSLSLLARVQMLLGTSVGLCDLWLEMESGLGRKRREGKIQA